MTTTGPSAPTPCPTACTASPENGADWGHRLGLCLEEARRIPSASEPILCWGITAILPSARNRFHRTWATRRSLLTGDLRHTRRSTDYPFILIERTGGKT